MSTETAPPSNPVASEAPSPESDLGKAPIPQVSEPKKDPLSPKFAALTRKEKELRTREIALKERESKASSWESESKGFKERPLEFMAKHGLTYEQLTHMILNDGKPTQDQKNSSLEEKVTNLQKQIEDREAHQKAEAEKQAQAQVEQVVASFKSDIIDFISKNSEAYELIATASAQDTVYEVVEEHYRETGRVLTISEAADLVENHLFTESQKFLGLKKFQKKEPSSDPSSHPGSSKPEPISSKTLSNSMSSSASSSRPLSEAEHLERAIQLLKFT